MARKRAKSKTGKVKVVKPPKGKWIKAKINRNNTITLKY